MKNDFEKEAAMLLNSPAAGKLAGKQDDIQKIASSREGQKVKAILESEPGLGAAIENGDMEALKRAFNKIMQTEEGKSLTNQISEMMK